MRLNHDLVIFPVVSDSAMAPLVKVTHKISVSVRNKYIAHFPLFRDDFALHRAMTLRARVILLCGFWCRSMKISIHLNCAEQSESLLVGASVVDRKAVIRKN